VKRLGILISGRGSNMVALVDAISEGRVPNAQVSIVISDQASASGLVKARERGLDVAIIERAGRSREDHDKAIIEELKRREVDFLCLAGYMRILSNRFIELFRNRMINIHPSLLPSFPGLHAQKQAIEHGVKWSGCTVHFVDETLDGGPIIDQRAVPVYPSDTVDTLSDRILVEEHKLYPEALARILNTPYSIVGRRVIFQDSKNE
jgi:phosphoribosylglycinamide formyltransferase 1